MKIQDNGFTERVATPVAPPTSPPETGRVVSNDIGTNNQTTTVASDNLQLSGFAARLNSGLAADTANRADNVSRIADAVNAGTFQIDTAAVTRSIVTEGLQSNR
jgi:anti-sigma28 factor (negative regulator of flagellin synthesis)